MPAPAVSAGVDADDVRNRLALANATADAIHRSALLIGEDNQPLEWTDLESAVSSGQPYVVRPRKDLLAVDLDISGVDDEEAKRRCNAYEDLKARLGWANTPLVEVASGGTGHRHLFAVVGDLPASVRRTIDGYARAGGLDVRTTGIRPPLSPHRHGRPVCLLEPATATKAVALLEGASPDRDKLSVSFGLQDTHPAADWPLTERMFKTLRFGHKAGGYRSPSEGRMALAVAAVSKGLDSRWLHQQLIDPRNALGESFRSRTEKWQVTEVKRIAKKATGWLATAPSRAASGLEAVATAARAYHWAGMSGGTDLAVLEAMITAGERQRTDRPQLAVSTVALQAGVGQATAKRALKRLAESGWVAKAADPTPTTSTVWRLAVPEAALAAVEADIGVEATTSVDLGGDAMRWKGVGKAAGQVLRLLGDEPVRASKLADQLGKHLTTVTHHLKNLEKVGLAVKDTDGGWARGTAALDEVAAVVGTAGSRRRQQAEIARQRAAREQQAARPPRKRPDGPPLPDAPPPDGHEPPPVDAPPPFVEPDRPAPTPARPRPQFDMARPSRVKIPDVPATRVF